MSGLIQKREGQKFRPPLSAVVCSGSTRLRMLHALYWMCLKGKIRDVCVHIFIYTYCSLEFCTSGDIVLWLAGNLRGG